LVLYLQYGVFIKNWHVEVDLLATYNTQCFSSKKETSSQPVVSIAAKTPSALTQIILRICNRYIYGVEK
jgi:hypothetical protein